MMIFVVMFKGQPMRAFTSAKDAWEHIKEVYTSIDNVDLEQIQLDGE